MIELISMTEQDYDDFMAISILDQINGQIEAEKWTKENAEANMQQMIEQVLPDGLDTPNHNFYIINDPESNANAGALWYTQLDNQGQQMFFVLDIQVYPEFKRCGYGTEAFAAMEEKALDVGVKMIALSVFPHNIPARNMYKKLGYVDMGENMVKQLG